MYLTTVATTLLLLLRASGAIAQTPADSSPSTNSKLDVTYGNTAIQPGEEYPQALTAQQPRLNTRQAGPGPYMLVMLDLSLPRSFLGPGPTAPGIGGSNRTTRLHWLQTNLTVGANGLLSATGNTPAVARYAAPAPPRGDIPHVYTWYLFTQPSTFQVPAALAGGALSAPSSSQRNNFSIATVAGQQGVELREANHFRVQNANNPGAVTTAPGLTPNATMTTTPSMGNASGSAVTPPVASFTGSAGKLGVLLPLMGVGAFAALLL